MSAAHRTPPRGTRGAPTPRKAAAEKTIVRSEEELEVGKVVREAGRVRARKIVDTVREELVVPRGTEHAEIERVAPNARDSGQVETLGDGSVSIPVFEEQVIIEKRLVVRERIIIRKLTVTEDHLVEANLRKERVVVDADPQVEARIAAPGATRARRPKKAAAATTAKRTRRRT